MISAQARPCDLEPSPEPVADPESQPEDHRERGEGRDRQQGVDRQQNRRRADDHQDVGHEVEHAHRQERADPIRVGADPRHQIAGPLASEELQGESMKVLVGLRPKVGADPLADPCDDVSPGPAKQPRQDRRPAQATQIKPDEREADRLAVLARVEHLVNQRDRQVRRNQAGGRARQRQDEAKGDRPGPRSGEPQEPDQRRGGRHRGGFRRLDILLRDLRPGGIASTRLKPGDEPMHGCARSMV